MNQNNFAMIYQTSWDGGHAVDLALKDVCEGKVGSSKSCFKYFISRMNIFANELNRGKGEIAFLRKNYYAYSLNILE